MTRDASPEHSPCHADHSVAVTGIACRLPGAPDIDALWALLAAGRSALRPIPADRWNLDHLYHPERKTPGRTVNRQAGLIDAIDQFDAAFFGLSAREARALDPQQRLLLETTWHALEDAGLAPESLRGQRVGVYAAAMANDYQQHTASPFRAPDAYAATGSYAALLANRLSGFFGWRGESITVDTACASSLAALHQARLALLNGTVDYCVVGAANALISPWRAVAFSQAGMLSGDSLCKTFAEGADGYVPGEGVVVLVLRRTADALNAGDRIHGVLLGTALNHMGPTPTLTAPSVDAEAEVIGAALRQAGIDPAWLSYVECHGTGTALGDPIEVEALARALPAGRAPVVLGSIKTNIGHLEAAAGLAGVLKVLLMLRHGQIPPTLHLTQDNPLIDFAALPFTPARTLLPWDSRPRLAGVSAFGFGGAGGHAIFSEAPTRAPVRRDAHPARPVPLLLSAADPTALRNLALNLAEYLEQPNPPDLDTLGQALALQRGSLSQRRLIRAQTHGEAVAELRRADVSIRTRSDLPPRVAVRLWPGSDVERWQAARRQIPGLERIAHNLERSLARAGFHPADSAIAAYVETRAWLELLMACGVEPCLLHAFGTTRPAALAAAGVLDDLAAARLACHGQVAMDGCRRPVLVYRDGDTGIELPPLRPAPPALLNLCPTSHSELLALGHSLWRSNHTFRAHFEAWQDLLGAGLGERLKSEEASADLALAVAVALWSTCARWSLRPPTVAAQWAAWPVAGWVADGLVDRPLALEVIRQQRPYTALAEPLARIARLPSRHPWLDQQRGHVPEWAGLASPLAGPDQPPQAEAADWVVVLGDPHRAPSVPTPSERLLYLNPAEGLAGLEDLLAELWQRGAEVHRQALGLPRPHLALPHYPFTRQVYWLSRLPEDKPPVLWETGQTLDTAVPVAPITPAPPPPVIETRDWVASVRACVADTLEADIADIDLHKSLDSQGIDSLISMDLAARIERATGVKLSPAAIEELNSVTALAERVAREAQPEASSPASQAPPPGPDITIRALHQTTPGLLASLAPAPTRLPAPGPGQVQVRIHAAGLNFKDVMIALDALPEARGEPLGLEFCGAVQALGVDVIGFKPGQRVFGIVSGAFAEAANVNAALLAPAPDLLNDAECAALPIAYLTALRCLELKPGDAILIHAATGGLGQAALRLAQAAGARIFATAGSPEKRAWLEAQGVAKAMDSRGLDFADQILAATDGRGVDVVLNSLTGAALECGLACLAEGGVFVEVGKTDLRDPAAIAQRYPGRRYRIYDLVAEIRTQPVLIGGLLRELGQRIAQGQLPPLPVETFALDAAANAFQHMARARHRGKIVLLADAPRAPQPSAPSPTHHPATDFPLAVIGYSGRFPGAEDCAALWDVLQAGRPVTGEVPAGRWSARELALFASGLNDPARLTRGGFLTGAENFDAQWFGFSPREARATDPRQRLLLEETWKALYAAGLEWHGPGASLRPAGIGVFVAADAGDYGFKRATAGARGDQLALAGNLPSSLAARLAHVFDCAGPALTLDLSCAASLGALWAARQALAQGDCRCAVVAAVSLHSTPMLAAQLGAADLLSAQGRILPFTVEADGLVPAEACVALVVKPLELALAAGDTIHAVLRGIGVAHDGLGRGFTLPSAGHLADLYAATLARAGLDAEQIDAISTHGVGTRGGDAAEITALAQTFAPTANARPLITAKPLLGHTLAAAGLTAVVHTLLQLRHNRLLPVGLAGRTLIPEWDATRFYFPTEASAWPTRADGQPRRVLLNTFAINGSQGAAVIEDAPTAPAAPFPRQSTRPWQRRRFWLDSDEPEALPNPPAAPDPAAGLREELSELLQAAPDTVDLQASPVAMGLSSLLAIELQHRIQRRYGLALGLDEILGVTRLVDLVPRLAEADTATTPPPLPIDDTPYAPFPLTELQAAYWSGRQPDVPLGGTDCQVYWEFECAKPWPVADLEAAWNRLVAAHPMLRAVIDSEARQRVLAEVPAYRFECLDLTGDPNAAERRQILRSALETATLDPGTWPLFRLAVSRDGERQRLHCVLNLLVLDVLSLYSLLDQLALLADNPAEACTAPALSFRQCVHALRDAAHSEAWRKAESFWAERGPQLPPAPDLPMTQPLSHLGRLTTRRFQARLSATEWQAIAAGAKQHGQSPSVVFLTVFAATLAHWTRSPRFTLNLTTHTRPPLHPEVKRVVGNFTGTVLLDVELATGQPFRALAARVGLRLREHLGQTAYPGVQVLRRRAAVLGWDAGLMPVVFTSMLGYESLRSGGNNAAPLIGSLIHGATRTPQVTLDAQVQADAEGILLSWDVAESVFPEGLPEAMFAAWTESARALAAPSGWEDDIPARIARREAEARAIANADTGPVPDEPLYAPFLRQAAAHPERIALIAPDRTLSYGELAGHCAGLAAQLRAMGACPGELIAVAMAKGWRQVMAAIAVQMAGAAYLPLATDLPPARFQHLAERGEVRLALTETGRDLSWPDGVTVIAIDADGPVPGNPADLPLTDPDSLAYVIFTSGSTGEPKGVMLTHRAALNTCLDINRRFAIGPEDRVLALSALSFDLSVWDIFGMLAAGAALVLPQPASASDPAYLAELMRTQRITIWNSVPMYLELFLAGEPTAADIAALRVVMLSGDWIALGLAGRLRAVAPAARAHSLGGATEAAIWSIHHPIDATPRPGWPSVPYGRALDNQTMQVLDGDLTPCPDGVAGDLYIGGIGLALGYWRDPERTAAAFITHPVTGERLYRTGDLARWREAGLLEFLGRRDGQVKIDGFRVELGEIEAVLRAHPAVREAVAVAPADGQGRRRLAAFCLLDADITPEQLLDHLRTRLPAYMIPKELRILARLPLNDNEKIDRRALAELAFRADAAPAAPAMGADAGELERRLVALWGEVISEARGMSCVPDPRRNLFELGADSLMAVIASRRIARELGITCTVTEIFAHATIARMAKALAERLPAAAPTPISPLPAPSVRSDRRRAFRSRLD